MNSSARNVTPELRAKALRLAAMTGTDPRTALRALLVGVDEIRTMTVRENLRRAIDQLAQPSGAAFGEGPQLGGIRA